MRFPSLKYNTHRRFCYVQFTTSANAEAATAEEGKKVGPKQKLIVKISNPAHKQERSGAIHEGREVFLKNIDFKATEADIKELFEQELGTNSVVNIRLPTKTAGKHMGYGFVVLDSKENAVKALNLNNSMLLGRNLSVRSAEEKKHGVAPGIIHADEPSEDQNPTADVIKGKSLAILNLPDTVNDTRVREVFEPYGALRKLQLRPDHGGAIIEYVDIKDAGKAELALGGYKFTEMTEPIKFGTRSELLSQRPDKKGIKGAEGKPKSTTSNVTFAAPNQINRNRGASRGRGGRGGLGFTSAAFRKKEPVVEGSEKSTEKAQGSGEESKPKSNADFKAMFLKK